MFHKVNPDNLKPCAHMQTLVSAWLDGHLSGLARWYTARHVRGCAQCQASLPFLRGLRARLLALPGDGSASDTPDPLPVPAPTLTPQRWNAVEAAWQQADKAAPPAPRPDEG